MIHPWQVLLFSVVILFTVESMGQNFILLNSRDLIHPTMMIQSQKWTDQPGTLPLEVAIPFSLPGNNGTCNSSFSITGSVCVVANETLNMSIMPTMMSFTLATGPSNNGPKTNLLGWLIPTTNSTGLSTQLLAVNRTQTSSGEWKACLDNVSFGFALRFTSLQTLSGPNVYWLITHAILNKTSTLRFYWRVAARPVASIVTVNHATFRDRSDFLGRQWLNWTDTEVYEGAFYPTDPLLGESLHLPAVIIESSQCSISLNASSPSSTPVKAPVSNSGSSTLIPTNLLPSTEDSPEDSPSSLDNNNTGVTSGPKSILGTFSTRGIIGIASACILVFTIVLVVVVIGVRRWRERRRHQEGVLGMREYNATQGGTFMIIDGDTGGGALAMIHDHGKPNTPRFDGHSLPRKNVSNEESQDDNSSKELLNRSSKTKHNKLTRSNPGSKSSNIPSLDLTANAMNAAPWIKNNGTYSEVDLQDEEESPRSDRSNRSVGLIDDGEPPSNGTPRGGSKRGNVTEVQGMRRNTSTGDSRKKGSKDDF